jgi:hypothetical protein
VNQTLMDEVDAAVHQLHKEQEEGDEKVKVK